MKKSTFSQYAIDNASILFLAQIRKDHTNSFRFTMTLTEDICPDTLQMAVDRIYRRFPTILAGFQPGFFHYLQIPVKEPPRVRPDPGCLLPMSRQELQTCAYRVYYSGKNIAIEAFHALTDGHGAIASFSTLIAEYLHLKYGAQIPVSQNVLDPSLSPMLHELEDSFLDYEDTPPARLPRRYAYQLPGADIPRSTVKTCTYTVPTETILSAAHHYGVTVNTLISTLMATSVMEVQQQCSSQTKLPVRIMVPVNLRKIFPSRTLRNFSYYALPTLEPQDAAMTLREQLRSFTAQIKAQMHKDHLGALISYNVKMQNSWYFSLIPLALKCALMRLICQFFGERTSSVTVTNLGNVTLPEAMQKYVTAMDVTLTPRICSPYGCALLSYKDKLTITISRFPQDSRLDAVFSRKLQETLYGDHNK